MKPYVLPLIIFALLFVIPQNSEAQLFKKLQRNVEDRIEKEAERRADRRLNKTIDKGFDEIEDTIDGENENGKNENGDKNTQGNSSTNENTSQEANPEMKTTTVVWNKFDFVPGDEVIFEDGPSADEENGEFPSRWDLHEGNVEVGEVNGENVIMFLSHQSSIIPYLKNSNEDYLPDVFTLELDVWFAKGSTTSNRLWIYLCDKKNNSQRTEDLCVMPHGLEFMDSSKDYPGTENLGWSNEKVGSWKHISIAYTKGKYKAYFNDTRLINIPHLEINPSGITIKAGNDNMYIKNIRIAKGGVKYYDRVLSDGKIIVNGIRFDVNKATIKPESNGAINEIFQLMQKQTELNFSVEGHTDSDGEEALNQTLSEGRAKSVMERLISMGISANRLKSAGWGESKPIGENGTAEGKANNRRVEFVKFTGTATSSSEGKSSSKSINPAFDKLDESSVKIKLYELFEKEHYTSVPISNSTGIINGAGTIILYATSDGYLGKMEILNVDKSDSYKLTIKYVTYNEDGSIHCKSNHLVIEETYTCDLDKENAKDMIQSEIDFYFAKQDKNAMSINPGELTSLRILR